MKHEFRKSRRRMLKHSAYAVSGIVVLGSGVLRSERLHAEELPHLSEDDQMAKQLKYVHDASASDARPSEDQLCSNCLHYEGEEGAEWGPCKIFPGKAVNANGWCSAWVKKA